MFALFLIYFINLLLIFFMIFCEQKRLHRVAIWLLIFTLFPIISFLIYLLLGIGVTNKKKKKLSIYKSCQIFKWNIKREFENINSDFKNLQQFNLLNHNALVFQNESIKIFTDNKVQKIRKENGEYVFIGENDE